MCKITLFRDSGKPQVFTLTLQPTPAKSYFCEKSIATCYVQKLTKYVTQLQSKKSEQRQNKPKQLWQPEAALPDAARAWLKQLPLMPKQPHLRSKFENTSQAGAESEGPKQPSSLRGHAEPKQPNSHRPPEAPEPAFVLSCFWIFFLHVNGLCDFIVCSDACQSALARTLQSTPHGVRNQVPSSGWWHEIRNCEPHFKPKTCHLDRSHLPLQKQQCCCCVWQLLTQIANEK